MTRTPFPTAPPAPAGGAVGLHYTARLRLADGSPAKVGTLVNSGSLPAVLAVDLSTGAVAPTPLTDSGKVAGVHAFHQVSVAKPYGSGRAAFGAGADTLVLTDAGWTRVAQLRPTDRLGVRVTRRLSSQQLDLIRGSLMGDGCLSPTPSGHGARLRWTHGAAQSAYVDWKASMLGNVAAGRSVRPSDGAVSWDFSALPELADLRNEVYTREGKRFSQDYLTNLGDLGLALWYLDDGHFQLRTEGRQQRTMGGSGRVTICVQAMTPATRARLVHWLGDLLGGPVRLTYEAGKATVKISTPATRTLHERLADFVHPSMGYKLLPPLRNRFAVRPAFTAPVEALSWLPLLHLADKPPTRSTHYFRVSTTPGTVPLVDDVPLLCA